MRCKLHYTSNPDLQQFIGEIGELTTSASGGYSFEMNNGKTINTSEVEPNTTLGDVNYLPSPSISFKTRSGTIYDFDNVERERVVDGCFKKDNQFLGFDKEEPEINI